MTTRSFDVVDIAAGLTLCRLNGWNQLARDWELFLHENAQCGRVALNDFNQIIGTATTIRYDHFSWIGMMLVDPAFQRQGVGQRLLVEALDLLRKESTIRLDATPAGRTLYGKHGFTDELELCRMHMGQVSSANRSPSVRPLVPNDWHQILELDAKAFGSDRKNVLKWSIQGAPELALVWDGKSGIAGFSLGRNGYRFTHIGPIIATDPNVAVELAQSALTQCKGPVILDVPHGGPLQDWLLQNGFTEMRRLIRMQRGKPFNGGDSQRHFAILGPELG